MPVITSLNILRYCLVDHLRLTKWLKWKKATKEELAYLCLISSRIGKMSRDRHVWKIIMDVVFHIQLTGSKRD